jgi:tetratricopeptide (TPR) repeat protein
MVFEARRGPLCEAKQFVRLAQENVMKGDHSSAIKYLYKAIDMYPNYAEAYAQLGNCQDCLEKFEDAIAAYNKALHIDPDNAETWFNKGMSLKKNGQIDAGTKCIEKSINLFCGR